MSNKAKVVSKAGRLTPNGRERIQEVHMGEKGTGKQVGASVIYWPWSAQSCEQADRITAEIARTNDLELVWDEAEY